MNNNKIIKGKPPIPLSSQFPSSKANDLFGGVCDVFQTYFSPSDTKHMSHPTSKRCPTEPCSMVGEGSRKRGQRVKRSLGHSEGSKVQRGRHGRVSRDCSEDIPRVRPHQRWHRELIRKVPRQGLVLTSQEEEEGAVYQTAVHI